MGFQFWGLRRAEYLFITITPKNTLTQTVRVLTMGGIDQLKMVSKMILNDINTLVLKTLILQLGIKYLPVQIDYENAFLYCILQKMTQQGLICHKPTNQDQHLKSWLLPDFWHQWEMYNLLGHQTNSLSPIYIYIYIYIYMLD